MRVKICGLTRAEDASLAHSLGAWALGLIFYPKSKRFIDADKAKEIVASLPRDALPIGVFVNQTEDALKTAETVGLKGLQLHGDETPNELRHARANFGGVLIKALRPKTDADLQAIAEYKGLVDYILLDAATGAEYGGTGHTGDWSLARRAAMLGVPVIVAGGLGPENILDAFENTHPFAFDLASGVEASPGVKDPEKLKLLFATIQEASHAA
ncbi:MAG TPA: phosphoribosylanthranilate isomerase [Patescibacteria group bacterium]|nr:phosphoribosylanthranilate isomerase [Patescibacteria group bacterium]